MFIAGTPDSSGELPDGAVVFEVSGVGGVDGSREGGGGVGGPDGAPFSVCGGEVVDLPGGLGAEGEVSVGHGLVVEAG